MRQFSGFATPEETNRRYHYLLEQGQTGLSVAFDLPTLMGYDADDPMAEGEVGKCGAGVSSLEDMEILLRGIPLDKISISMTINSPAAVLWAMYLAVAEQQGVGGLSFPAPCRTTSSRNTSRRRSSSIRRGLPCAW